MSKQIRNVYLGQIDTGFEEFIIVNKKNDTFICLWRYYQTGEIQGFISTGTRPDANNHIRELKKQFARKLYLMAFKTLVDVRRIKPEPQIIKMGNEYYIYGLTNSGSPIVTPSLEIANAKIAKGAP